MNKLGRIKVEGEITERRVVEYDLFIAPQVQQDEDAEILIKINGRMMKRMSVWQARRLGIFI